MKNINISAPNGAQYLSDFMKELPVNCLFNKGKTGCGGTELALRNDVDTIIAVPYISLLKSKMSQHDDRILCVYGETDTDDIRMYLARCEKTKIMVTYDSLGRLLDILEMVWMNVYQDVFLLVDEWQVLFNSYVFRNRAIRNLLRLASRFDRVTYMTATPVDDEFMLEELKGLDRFSVKWSDKKPMKVNQIITNNPATAVCKLIDAAMSNKILDNLHIFVNSVTFIEKIYTMLELTGLCTRVVCSKNNKDRKRKLSFIPNEITDPIKPINFYTSTCFEGCDIYDPDGRIVIVSDGQKAHTLLDISTLFVQICGRIRNSKYADEVTHIFNETRYSKATSLEEYKEISRRQVEDAESLITEVNAMTEKNRTKIIAMIEKGKKGGLNERYVSNVNNRLVLDRNLVKVDILNFKLCSHLYSSCEILEEAYRENGMELRQRRRDYFSDMLAADPTTKISFKNLFEEYAEIRKAREGLITFENDEDPQRIIERERPLVKEAYETLGVEKVRELKYHVTNIKRELLKKSDATIDLKVYRSLQESGYREGTEVSTKKLKETLQTLYDVFGKKSKAKASDIKQWYDFKRITKKENGKSVEYISILKEKIVYE